jgi:hypothetical protein
MGYRLDDDAGMLHFVLSLIESWRRRINERLLPQLATKNGLRCAVDGGCGDMHMGAQSVF